MSLIDLDHVGVAVEDIDAAAAAFRRLGFAPTARGLHVKRDEHGALYRSGTGNRCLVFRSGFVELLGVTDAAIHPGWLPTYLERYHGLHILGFGTDDIRADAARLRRALPELPTRQLYQTVDGDEGELAAFGVIDIPREAIGECHVVLIEHETRAAFFRADWQDHPNGATALITATLVASGAENLAVRLGNLLGGEARQTRPGHLVMDALHGARVEIVDHEGWAQAYPGIVPPVTPWMGAFGVATRDVEGARRLLEANGVAFAERGGRLVVPPEEACGATVTFEQAR